MQHGVPKNARFMLALRIERGCDIERLPQNFLHGGAEMEMEDQVETGLWPICAGHAQRPTRPFADAKA